MSKKGERVASGSIRVVRFSQSAARDLEEIYSYTAHFYGIEQAEQYLDFLRAQAEAAAEGPEPVLSPEAFPDLSLILVKWSGARHGHYLVAKLTKSELLVVRVLHTAMDLESRLGNDGYETR